MPRDYYSDDRLNSERMLRLVLLAGALPATGKVGVCMATSGPGATNLVTGLAELPADAWLVDHRFRQRLEV